MAEISQITLPSGSTYDIKDTIARSELDNKVDKVSGKQLSTNDYTTTEKNKLAGIAAGAETNVQSDWNETDTTSDAYIKNKPTIPTDTWKVFYGTCTTAAGTRAKAVTVPADQNFSLRVGAIVAVKFSNTNTYSNVATSPITLNVNSTGAKNIWYNTTHSGAGNTGTNTTVYGTANRYTWYMYDGTYWTWVSQGYDNNSTYTPASAAPIMDGTAAVGTSTKYAREDHVHPSDTTKVDKVSGKGLSTNDFTTTLLNKLNGIAAGAEVNVQSDWNETSTSSDAYIKNKPSIPTKTSDLTNDSDFVSDANYVHTDNNFTTTLKNKLDGIAAGAEVNVQSDWNVTDTSSDAFIKNKPTIPTVPGAASTAPKMDGTAAVGTSTKYARQDHVHPTDTSRVPTTRTINGKALSSNVTLSASDVNALPSDTEIPTKTSDLINDSDFAVDTNYVHTDNNYTTTEKNKLNGIAAGAEVNQNAFSKVTIGTTTIEADSKTDTLTLVAGSNVTLTPDATNDKITIAATNTTYTPASSAPGKVASASAVGTSTNYARQDHTHGIDLATGDNNGQVKIAGTNVSVKGLGTAAYTASGAYLASDLKGAANGVAQLDANGLVPSSQLPSYVDDVLEYSKKSSFPATGQTGKIYVDTTTNLTYRWSGSAYVQISPSLALGTTSSTAYRGDYGNTAYTHATDSSRLTTATSSGLYKVAATAQGHIASLTAVTKADITALGIPGTDTNTDTKVTQTNTTTNADYRVLFSENANDTTQDAGARKNTNFKYNPSTGNVNLPNLIASGKVTVGNHAVLEYNAATVSLDFSFI